MKQTSKQLTFKPTIRLFQNESILDTNLGLIICFLVGKIKII